MICDTCQGNGYIRVATGDTSIDFRDNSQVQQCWDCDSEGEFYETIEVDNISNDANGSDSIH
jgi:DnaJ-class molecular chaperone